MSEDEGTSETEASKLFQLASRVLSEGNQTH